MVIDDRSVRISDVGERPTINNILKHGVQTMATHATHSTDAIQQLETTINITHLALNHLTAKFPKWMAHNLPAYENALFLEGMRYSEKPDGCMALCCLREVCRDAGLVLTKGWFDIAPPTTMSQKLATLLQELDGLGCELVAVNMSQAVVLARRDEGYVVWQFNLRTGGGLYAGRYLDGSSLGVGQSVFHSTVSGVANFFDDDLS